MPVILRLVSEKSDGVRSTSDGATLRLHGEWSRLRHGGLGDVASEKLARQTYACAQAEHLGQECFTRVLWAAHWVGVEIQRLKFGPATKSERKSM